jgi:Flp pilus assembly protein TadD
MPFPDVPISHPSRGDKPVFSPVNPNTPLLRPSFFRTLFFVAVAIVALVLFDSVFARVEREETARAAARFYSEGEQLMHRKQYEQAADAFRSAIANARQNREYPLALGEALLAAGKPDQAAEALQNLLAEDSMAGPPNLAMARVYASKGEFGQADFYYHRSIYGQWPREAGGSSVDVRMELADSLAKRGDKAQLLAELLPLQDEAPRDPATQEKLGRWFLTAGSPARALVIFRDLTRGDSQDYAAYDGLGEAELASGDCSAAQSAFGSALRLNPGDPKAARPMEVCAQETALDPSRHGIDSQERYRRSLNLLRLVASREDRCGAPSANLTALVDAAQDAPARKVKPAEQSEAGEADLDLAVRLWRAEQSECHLSGLASDDAIEMVLSKTAR